MTAITRPSVSSSKASGERPAALRARTTAATCGSLTIVLPARMPYPRPCKGRAGPGYQAGKEELAQISGAPPLPPC